jgi:hypothetical protein
VPKMVLDTESVLLNGNSFNGMGDISVAFQFGALIKLSFSQLDQRMDTLESDVGRRFFLLRLLYRDRSWPACG